MSDVRQMLVRVTPAQLRRIRTESEEWMKEGDSYRSFNDYLLMKILAPTTKGETQNDGGVGTRKNKTNIS